MGGSFDWQAVRRELTVVFEGSTASRTLRCSPLPEVPITTGALAATIQSVVPGETVLLIGSDQTRKTGLDRLLPVLLDGFAAHGVPATDISLLIACGAHRQPDAEELARVVGPAAERLNGRIHLHNAFDSDCEAVGITSRGTPVRINRRALDADAVIPIGAVLFHYFAGMSGGAKSVVPGVAAATTIAANHSLTISRELATPDPNVRIGRLEGNPVSDDLWEATGMVAVRSAIQTVLAGDGRLVGLFAGPLHDAHRQACDVARRAFGCPLDGRSDLVIAAAGVALNWIQSHKSLVNASLATKPDGVIILHAPCPEGVGSESFEYWLSVGDAAAIIRGIGETADINSQTALSTLTRGRQAILISDLPTGTIRRMGMTPAADLTDALMQARERLRANRVTAPGVTLMPEAWLTVPQRFAARGSKTRKTDEPPGNERRLSTAKDANAGET